MELLDKQIDENRQGEVYKNTSQTVKKEGKKYFLESYGCAMNFSDSEIVASILNDEGYVHTTNLEEADLILVNTCSIREKAEQTVRSRLHDFKNKKRKNKGILIGILGCMAERLKTKFLEEEQLVDLVVGPDAYRSLPALIKEAESGTQAINVFLSREETYADIAPVRLMTGGISAFVSIMRGCDNMCSFCVVPYTRGRERSRNAFTIIAELNDLVKQGYKEVTLLGQNVDSYKWENPETKNIVSFADLLELSAHVSPQLRIRFSTSHPKDITEEVMYAIKKHPNLCDYIHLPAQSGSSRILKKMNRTYDREWYIKKVDAIRSIIPDCAITSDFISGFCSETEEEHQESLRLIEYVKYTSSFMFFYSERPGTPAAKKYEDDIPLKTKKRRLQEIIDLQAKISTTYNESEIGKIREVLIEGFSKRSDKDYHGRTSQNVRVIFPVNNKYKTGDYVQVLIKHATSRSLKGEIVST